MKRAILITVLVAAGSCLSTSAASAGSIRFFDTPDHNISCAMAKHTKKFKGSIRCDMVNHSWTSPRPKYCEFDSGGGFSLTEHGKPKGQCVSDAIAGQGPILAPGATASKGQFSCTLDPTGVSITCINRKNKHGFAMDPSSYKTF